MDQYVIKGEVPLKGTVEIGGAKNAALAILAAAVMTDETVVIDNLPDVRDINVLLQAIAEIGAKVERTGAHSVKMIAPLFIVFVLTMNLSRRSELLIIFWAHTSENTKKLRSLFRADVISEADRSIFIRKAFVH